MATEAVVATLREAGCVFAEDEAALLLEAAPTPEALAGLVARRVEGIPLEQILGWAEFRGLRVHIEPGVFVPRRRTEFLAEQAIEYIRPGSVVVDVCCGSGAIGAAVAAQVGQVELYATDIDAAAVRCARRNVPSARVDRGDLFEPLPRTLRGRVELAVANVPYVPTTAIGWMPPEAREHEPAAALDGGADGLDVLRRVAAAAPYWLAPGGRLLIEVDQGQQDAAAACFTAHGLRAELVRSDSATVVVGMADAASQARSPG